MALKFQSTNNKRLSWKTLVPLALTALTFSSQLWAYFSSDDEAKRFFERIAGVPPTQAQINSIRAAGDLDTAKLIPLNSPYFYNVTLKNMITPWTNEAQTPFAPLNDYTATVIGIIAKDDNFKTVLSTDKVYTAGNNVGTAYSLSSNQHYLDVEQLMGQGESLADILSPTDQLLPAPAGIMTTRAAGRAFFSGGTNRAMLRFTLINHLCMDLEQFKDTSRPADRIRQDVSRSPGGDSSIFLNNCIGCHSGMDPLAQAFAYYDYEYGDDEENIENGTLVYNTSGTVDPETVEILEESPSLERISDPNILYRVQEKYFYNATTFPYGYVTTSDQWTNYWREGRNRGVLWNAGLESPGSTGFGANSLGQELANSKAFAQCHVTHVFKTVCLREPEDGDDDEINTLTDTFMGNNYNLKEIFALTGEYCAGD